MSKMSQIQTTLSKKDIKAVKKRAKALYYDTLSKLIYNQMIQNKGATVYERAEGHDITKGEAAHKCMWKYYQYWVKLDVKLRDAPLCSPDGIAYMKRIQKRADYAIQWIMQTKKEELKAFYAKNQEYYNPNEI